MILLCDGLSCYLCGADDVRDAVMQKLGIGFGETTPDGKFTLINVCCVGGCDRAPAALVGPDRKLVGPLSADDLDRTDRGRAMSETPLDRPRATRSPAAQSRRMAAARRLRRAAQRAEAPYAGRDRSAIVEAAGLRGRGGAGFLTGTKWRLMRKAAVGAGEGPRYLCVNGDEMEPGSFKDRLLMEALPHQLIEGAMIAAYAIGATEVIILVRDAYRAAAAALNRAIVEIESAGLLGRNILGSGFALKMRVHASRRPLHRRRGDRADRRDRRRSSGAARIGRLIRRRAGCGDGRPRSTMSRRCRPCR